MPTKKKRKLGELPGEFVSYYSLTPVPKTLSKVTFSVKKYVVVARIGKGKWTMVPVHGNSTVGGIVGGYNVYTPDVAYMLADLRFWSKKDAKEFCDWYYKQRDKYEKESKIERAKEVLLEEGYTVRKKKK
jgi:hypothetical protein